MGCQQVLFVILIIALWVVNKWILKGKIRLLYRILISIGIPLILIGWDYYSTNSSFYSSSNMDKLLDGIGAGITLPLYEITSYKNEHVMVQGYLSNDIQGCQHKIHDFYS